MMDRRDGPGTGIQEDQPGAEWSLRFAQRLGDDDHGAVGADRNGGEPDARGYFAVPLRRPADDFAAVERFQQCRKRACRPFGAERGAPELFLFGNFLLLHRGARIVFFQDADIFLSVTDFGFFLCLFRIGITDLERAFLGIGEGFDGRFFLFGGRGGGFFLFRFRIFLRFRLVVAAPREAKESRQTNSRYQPIAESFHDADPPEQRRGRPRQ